MIDYEVLFTISYGLYIVSSGNREQGNGYISNTVFQVTAEPPRIATVCSKNNFTDSLIESTGAFSVSVLQKDTPPGIFGRFGFRSGSELDKLESMKIKYGETGVPIVLDESMAYLECRVIATVDLKTHRMYLADLVQSVMLDPEKEPMTYLQYRQTRKGFAPRNAPTFIEERKLRKE